MIRKTAVVAALAALLLCAPGCSKRVPLSSLAEGGAEVGAKLRTSSGERMEGLLVSMTDSAVRLEVEYAVRGDVSIRGTGERRIVYSGDDPIPGELLRVERRDGLSYATVDRTVALEDVVSMTFHRSRSEASLSPILSAVLGPLVGASVALIL